MTRRDPCFRPPCRGGLGPGGLGKRPMGPAEVVGEEVEGHGVGVVLGLPGEGVGQPGEAAAILAGVQVQPFHVGGRHQIEVRAPDHPLLDHVDYWSFQPYTDSTVFGTDAGIDEDVRWLSTRDQERLGYPTQKPEGLLERIITASSNEGDVILDAYCGCGTTVAVAHRLKREWIGMDITYQSIALILKRLESAFGSAALATVTLDDVPRDRKSAVALAHKKDDRLRKEFEKWALLTYSNNRAVVNDKKGADAGVDGRAYFRVGKSDNAKLIFQVKSGAVKRSDIAILRGGMGREKAVLGVLITLDAPTKPMVKEAKAAGSYAHHEMGRSNDQFSIVTVRQIVEEGARLEIPMSLEVLAAAKAAADAAQVRLEIGGESAKHRKSKRAAKTKKAPPKPAEQKDAFEA